MSPPPGKVYSRDYGRRVRRYNARKTLITQRERRARRRLLVGYLLVSAAWLILMALLDGCGGAQNRCRQAQSDTEAMRRGGGDPGPCSRDGR